MCVRWKGKGERWSFTSIYWYETVSMTVDVAVAAVFNSPQSSSLTWNDSTRIIIELDFLRFIQVFRPFFSPFDRKACFIKLISNIECNALSGRISREYQFMSSSSSFSSSSPSVFLANHALLWLVLYCMCFHSQIQKSEFSFAFHYFEFFDGCVNKYVKRKWEDREKWRGKRRVESFKLFGSAQFSFGDGVGATFLFIK